MKVNKSLLFYCITALFLLNTSACMAMDANKPGFDFNAVDPDTAKPDDVRAALAAAIASEAQRQKLAAELADQQAAFDAKATDIRQQLKGEYTAREKAAEAQAAKAEDARQAAELIKEAQRKEAEEAFLQKQKELKEALDKEQARPINQITAEYGVAPATDPMLSLRMAENQQAQARYHNAEAQKREDEHNSIRNSNYYVVATDWGKPVMEKLVLPIVQAELQPFVTEKRQDIIGKTKAEKRIDRMNELNEEITKLDKKIKKRTLNASEINEDHTKKMNRVDRLARIFENTIRYCNETNDKEGCRQLKDQFYALQKKHMDEFYKEEMGKDCPTADTPSSPVK